MKIVCPECQSQFPLSAGLLDAEAKRFGIAMAGLDPVVGRALVQYLALHKPEKTALRLTKAAKIAEEIAALVAAGTVRRNGTTRPAPPAVWATAMEHMVDQRGKLRLPLSGHGYLAEVVYGLADTADANAERQREAALRSPSRRAGPSDNVIAESSLQAELAWLRQQRDYGGMSEAEYVTRVAEARAKHGAGA